MGVTINQVISSSDYILFFVELCRQTKPRYSLQQLVTMTDTSPDTQEVKDSLMEDKNDDMFVSAMDSPTDSGLETNKTSNSDTMEDLSLQVRFIEF